MVNIFIFSIVEHILLEFVWSFHAETHKMAFPLKLCMTPVLSAKAQEECIALLLEWYEENGRHSLPWRQTRDPYSILVSELMLQQTQVPRVIPKYKAFLHQFPTLSHLANAPRPDVLRAWQGLGYNSRAVRLHALAKMLTEKNADLPITYEELLRLPGVGPYTAGAVMIFSHDKPAASVDVNVERIVRRLFFSKEEHPSPKALHATAFDLITRSNQPHNWQSALMDFGSDVCTARMPSCDRCPLAMHCKSRGVRPDEIREKPKQSTFKGSNRWWRGQILKSLLEKRYNEQDLLLSLVSSPSPQQKSMFADALKSLIAEKIVVKHHDGTLILVE